MKYLDIGHFEKAVPMKHAEIFCERDGCSSPPHTGLRHLILHRTFFLLKKAANEESLLLIRPSLIDRIGICIVNVLSGVTKIMWTFEPKYTVNHEYYLRLSAF